LCQGDDDDAEKKENVTSILRMLMTQRKIICETHWWHGKEDYDDYDDED